MKMTVLLEGYIGKKKVAEVDISNYTLKEVIKMSREQKLIGLELKVARVGEVEEVKLGCLGFEMIR